MRSVAYCSIIHAKIGTILITANNKKLLGVTFTENKYKENENRITKQVKQEIEEYLAGKRFSFSHYDFDLSSLQRAVFDLVSAVSYGKVITYNQIARKLDLYEEVQTIANTITHNPYVILIPSHRVVTDERKLYRYAGGIDKKRALLKLENRVSLELSKQNEMVEQV